MYANVFFHKFFFNLTLFMTKLKVLVLSFPDFTYSSNVLPFFFMFPFFCYEVSQESFKKVF
jgi:hypothetical protein